uniref:Uncharacterized protein n=1 Tax=Strongyloides venezuelensis TaxID=75913 RepID=A0A0K0FAE6_STRVS
MIRLKHEIKQDLEMILEKILAFLLIFILKIISVESLRGLRRIQVSGKIICNKRYASNIDVFLFQKHLTKRLSVVAKSHLKCNEAFSLRGYRHLLFNRAVFLFVKYSYSGRNMLCEAKGKIEVLKANTERSIFKSKTYNLGGINLFNLYNQGRRCHFLKKNLSFKVVHR